RIDPVTGKTSIRKNDPPPCYAHHCFVVARSAKQFFLHASFDPTGRAPEDQTCESIIQSVVSRHPSRASNPDDKIVIPGYAKLREFSAARADLLRQKCGGAWQSELQRGTG